MNKQRLDLFDNRDFRRGRPAWVELLWIIIQALLISSWVPGSLHRVALLKFFGAKVGAGVVIKPRVKIKFPWKLCVGNHAWIGENVWIDNLAPVSIGHHACVSQDAYLCTGSHNWSAVEFDLVVKPIDVGDSTWVGARATVGPGVTIGKGAVLGLGSTTSKDLKPWTIYLGAPAQPVKERIVNG